MKAVSSLAVLFAVLYSANALNTWCCYEYVHNLAGWFRVYTTPATPAVAAKVCAADGGKLATSDNDQFKVEMLKLAKQENVQIYGDLTPVPIGNTVFDQHRVIKPDGTMFDINSEDKNAFVCFRESKNYETNSCGLVELGYELSTTTKNCYKFHRELVHWNKANDTCNDEGAHLAVISSDAEADVLKNIFSEYTDARIPVPAGLKVGEFLKDYAFLGVTKVGNEWVTCKGETIAKAGYAKFAPGEPNNSRGDENCLAVSREGLLVDEPCTRSKPFICERTQNVSLCHNMHEKAKCNARPLPAV